MNTYKDLVLKVLKNDALTKHISTILPGEKDQEKGVNSKEIDLKKCINCISPNYKDVIENDIDIQDYITHGKSLWFNKKIIDGVYEFEYAKKSIKVLIVGNCKFIPPNKNSVDKTTNVLITNSEPLSKIAQAMTSDLGTEISISDDFKFAFNGCHHIVSCKDCHDTYIGFRNTGLMSNYVKQPCILTTNTYDGNEVKSLFLSLMENSFSEFVALLHLEIDRRYSYFNQNKQKIYRIGGKILNILGCYESKLDGETTTANIGFLGNEKIILLESDSRKRKFDELNSESNKKRIIKDDEIHSTELEYDYLNNLKDYSTKESNDKSSELSIPLKRNFEEETEECIDISNNKILKQINESAENHSTNTELFDLLNGLQSNNDLTRIEDRNIEIQNLDLI